MQSTLTTSETLPPARTASRWRPRHASAALALVPFITLLALFCLAPIAWVLIHGIKTDSGIGLEHFGEILSSPFYRQAFGNSLRISLESSALALLITLPGAASLARVPGRLRDIAIAFTNMTSNLAGVPLAFAFIIILGTNGAITLLLRRWGLVDDPQLYSSRGLILIYSYFQIPLGLLLLYPAFSTLDDDWKHAAALLGARPGQYWLRIALPVLSPAVFGTFILLFANAMGAYASAYALTTGNINLVTVRIASLVSGDIFLEPDMAAALSVMLMGLLILVTAVNQWLLKRTNRAS
jgi:putative spermidine/putrescine transport system permease protein